MRDAALTTPTYGDSWSSQGKYFSWPNRTRNLKSTALAVPKVFYGV